MPMKSASKALRKSNATALEVHKFGGASLADAAAYRHAAQIIKGRSAPCVVVVSAPAGVTDVLLGLARRAAAGEQEGLERDTEALRARCRDIARAAVGGETAAAGGVGESEASMDELSRLLSSLVVLKELTARTSALIAAQARRPPGQTSAPPDPT